MTHITCRLTAKNRDQLRNPTLCNRVWATFTFLALVAFCTAKAYVHVDEYKVKPTQDIYYLMYIIKNSTNQGPVTNFVMIYSQQMHLQDN